MNEVCVSVRGAQTLNCESPGEELCSESLSLS